jgi:hypothetical protein
LTFWQLIEVTVLGSIASVVLNYFVTRALFKWKKREHVPEDISELKSKVEALGEFYKDIRLMQKDLIAVRGEVLYLKGRINGTEWRKGAT